MISVLVAIEKPHNLPDILGFVKAVDSGSFRFLFLTGREFKPGDIECIRREGFAVAQEPLIFGKRAPASAASADSKTDTVKDTRGVEDRSNLRSIAYVVYYCLSMLIYTLFVRRIFQSERPDLVLMQNDRGSISTMSIAGVVAKYRSVPVVIPYFSVPSDGIKIRAGAPEYLVERGNAFFRLISSLRREQLTQINGEPVSFHGPEVIAALWLFRALSDNPWMVGNGVANVVCLGNQAVEEYYVAKGGPRAKSLIVGDLSNDKLFRSFQDRHLLRQNLLSSYSLPADRKTALIALPHLFEHKLCSFETHWRCLLQIFGALKKHDLNIIVSLHPKQRIDDYQRLVAEFGAVIVSERLSGILPIADVFLNEFSSTTYWAVLCGVPTVITDLYGLNYSIFDDFKSVFVARTAEDVAEGLQASLFQEISFQADWRLMSRESVFDGRTVTRYEDLFRSLQGRAQSDRKQDSGVERPKYG